MLLLVVQLFRVMNREITDIKKFTDYYEATDAANGGFEVLESNFITIEKQYVLNGKKFGKTEFSIPTFEIYEVKSGDSLYEIAKKFKLDLAILRANNPQVGNVLKVGDKLNILSGNGIFYKVKKGDSLYKISKKYNVKIDDIINYNKLDSNALTAGQSLYLPNPDLKRVKQASVKKSVAAQRNVAFSMPVKWRGVTSPFGRRYHPVLKRYIYHKGADLRAQYVPLYATKNGKVSYAGWMSGYGKIVIIKHSGGYETRSAHLNNIYVKPGQYVKQGQLIGKTGMTGRVTGPHLHFEIRKNGVPYNPIKYLMK